MNECCVLAAQGAQSHAIWHAWAGMEAKQGDITLVRYLYKRGLEANPRSRFVYLAWALFEKSLGSLDNARALLKQGHRLNVRDAAIVQVNTLPIQPSLLMLNLLVLCTAIGILGILAANYMPRCGVGLALILLHKTVSLL